MTCCMHKLNMAASQSISLSLDAPRMKTIRQVEELLILIQKDEMLKINQDNEISAESFTKKETYKKHSKGNSQKVKISHLGNFKSFSIYLKTGNMSIHFPVAVKIKKHNRLMFYLKATGFKFLRFLFYVLHHIAKYCANY